MSYPHKISPTVNKKLLDLYSTLSDEYDRLQNNFAQKSDTWKDSDNGLEADGYLDDLQTLMDEIDRFTSPVAP